MTLREEISTRPLLNERPHSYLMLFRNAVARINNKRLKRIDLDVLSRFINILCENNSVGITQLQMKTRTKYSACIRYVKFLEGLGLVKLTTKGKNKDVGITEKGRELAKILLA